ncbi:MAG: apolipoprotein N-acyltransferase [Paracoccaceae bacterium]
MADTTPLLTRLAILSGWRGLLAPMATGAIIALGLAPFSLIWLTLPALCLAVFFALSCPPKQAASRGFATGFGYALVSLSWITEPFFVDIARHGWMAPFALFFMAAGFGAFWALGFWAAARISPANSTTRAIAVPVFWTATELLRSYIFTGFPWGLLSYIWIDTPVYQFASYLGPHGLTLLSLGLATAFVTGLQNRNARTLIATSATGLILAAISPWITTTPATNADAPMVRLIQPNADQNEKWNPQMMPVFYDRQISLTEAAADIPPDIIIWPEVAVPFLLDDPTANFWEIAGAALDATVILGAQRFNGRDVHNSLAVLGHDGEILQTYDKQHLVPFGEYLPAADLLNRFGMQAMAAQFGRGYTAGQGDKLIDLGPWGKVLPLICYEGIFPHEVRDTASRPDWMLMITNDAWFGKWIGPAQHFAQAQARSIELGLPMVRVANTGISGVIDARGQIVDALPQGVAGFLDVRLPAARPPTLYSRFGDAPTLALLFILGLVTLRSRRSINVDPDAAEG